MNKTKKRIQKVAVSAKQLMKQKIVARLRFCLVLPKDRIAVACGTNINRSTHSGCRYEADFEAAFSDLLDDGIIELVQTGAYAGMYRLADSNEA